MAIIIKNVKYVTLVGDCQVTLGDIRIDGQYISEIAKNINVRDGDTIIDGVNKFLMPGFVNCHNHAAMTLFRGYGEGLPLMDWLNDKIWPAEARMSEDDVYWGTMLGHLEMIKSGTTTYADMYFFMDAYAKAVEDAGIRSVITQGITDLDGKGEEKLAYLLNIVAKYNHSLDGRLRVMLGAHSPYTCSEGYLRLVGDTAREHDLGIHIHIAETKVEFDDSMAAYNMSPLKRVNEFGLLDNHVLAAHMVYLTDEDIDIAKEKGTYIVHNPQSNMKLASGIAPVTKYLERGLSVALGTDGASSNNNLSMFDEMRSASLLQRVSTGNALALDPITTLKLATVNGAAALKWDNEIGTVEVGKKADLILVDIDKPHHTPQTNILSNMVFAAESTDVDTVIVDGKVLVSKGECQSMDEEKIIYETTKIAKRILG